MASSAGNPYILVSNDGDSFIQQFLDKTVFFEQQPLSHDIVTGETGSPARYRGWETLRDWETS